MRAVVSLLMAALSIPAWAAIQPVPTRRSDQFTVHDVRPLSLANPSWKPPANTNPLDSDILLISAERIKGALNQTLGLPQRGGGPIEFFLNRASANNQRMVIVPECFADGWQYRVSVPDHLEAVQLIRGIVEVLLMEFANRGSRPKCAEIPLWLNEGLSYHLSASSGPELAFHAVPSGTMARIVRNLRGLDPMRETREFLRGHAALSFTEMSQLTPADLSSNRFLVFQHSAHLLVNELARLPNGRASLVRMLRALPHFWNWESAFLQAYGLRFERMLDVEKWWSVNVLAFTGRDPSQTWPPALCLQKLDEILLAAAEVRLTTNTLPFRAHFTLQQVISDWSFEAQRPVLEQILNQLTALRYNCPLDTVTLVDQYRLILGQYLQNRARSGSTGQSKREVILPARVLAQHTIRKLDELYRLREAHRRHQMTVAAPPISPTP